MTTTPVLPDLTDVTPVRVNDLTLGEIAYFERRSGTSLASFGQDGEPMAAPLMVLAGVVLARTHQYPTWEAAQEAAEHLTIDQAMALIVTDEEDPAGE
nr:hypothetical protein [Actinomyces sp.]